MIGHWPLLKEVDTAEATVILDERDAESASEAAMAAISCRRKSSRSIRSSCNIEIRNTKLQNSAKRIPVQPKQDELIVSGFQRG